MSFSNDEREMLDTPVSPIATAQTRDLFGYQIAPCPFRGYCLQDAEWGHPCSRDERGSMLDDCEKRRGEQP